MQRAINGFYAKLKRGMTGLVFFSGYGIQANRQSYLIPVDVDIWNESEVAPKGISLDNILAEMNKRGANVKIAIVDAARRNPFERRFRKAGAEGLPPVSAPLGTLVLYSATAGTPGGLVKDSTRGAQPVRRRAGQGNPRPGRVRGRGVQSHPDGRVAGLLERAESLDLVFAEPGVFVSELRPGRLAAPPRVANNTPSTNTNTTGGNSSTVTSPNTSVNTQGNTTASNTNTFDVQSTRPPARRPASSPTCRRRSRSGLRRATSSRASTSGCGAIRAMPSRSIVAASSMPATPSSIARSPISTRRSGSSPMIPKRSTTAAGPASCWATPRRPCRTATKR